MPVWNAKTRELVRRGRLVVIGIAQEQHPERCRLFAQWHQLQWPILHDSINAMEVRGVPIEVAIDENGIVRSLRPDPKTFEEEFVERTFASDSAAATGDTGKATPLDLAVLRRRAQQSDSPNAWRDLGDAIVLWEGPGEIENAINAYMRAIRANPDDGTSHFRLGVCYCMRSESPQRRLGDFRMAVEHWTKARSIDPNQYIWRRRIEQFGPRQNKPYPFYDWVETAARDIRSRGDQPVELGVPPTGSELASPARSFEAGREDAESPDPEARIHRDTEGLVLTDVAVVPPQVRPGGTTRVHLTLRPNDKLKAHWNNEAEPVRLWVDPPQGWQVHPQLSVASQGDQAASAEPQSFEFEVQAPGNADGPGRLAAYVLYYVCEDTDDTCRFLRQDIPITVETSPDRRKD